MNRKMSRYCLLWLFIGLLFPMCFMFYILDPVDKEIIARAFIGTHHTAFKFYRNGTISGGDPGRSGPTTYGEIK